MTGIERSAGSMRSPERNSDALGARATSSSPAASGERIGRREQAWAAFAGAATVLTVAFCSLRSNFQSIDFGLWELDWGGIVECLQAHRGGHCGHVSKYPAAYLLNSAGISLLIGHTPLGSLFAPQQILVGLNGVFLLAPVGAALALQPSRRGALLAGALYLACLALSPLPPVYLNSGALELQGGVAGGLFIAAATARLQSRVVGSPAGSLVVLAGSALLFPLFKDTLIITAAMSGAVVVALGWVPPPHHLTLRPASMLIAAVLAVSVALMAALNLVRYGVPWPQAYFFEAAQTSPSALIAIEYLMGSIGSPNGGVVAFWSLPLFVAFAGLRSLAGHIDRASVTMAAIMALISLSGFSMWWSPFGWNSWGDRLMIQPMLSLLIVLVLTASYSGSSITSRRWWSWPFNLVALPVTYSAFYFLMPYLPGGADPIEASLFSEPECQQMRSHVTGRLTFWRSPLYYDCAIARLLYIPRLTGLHSQPGQPRSLSGK